MRPLVNCYRCGVVCEGPNVYALGAFSRTHSPSPPLEPSRASSLFPGVWPRTRSMLLFGGNRTNPAAEDTANGSRRTYVSCQEDSNSPLCPEGISVVFWWLDIPTWFPANLGVSGILDPTPPKYPLLATCKMRRQIPFFKAVYFGSAQTAAKIGAIEKVCKPVLMTVELSITGPGENKEGL